METIRRAVITLYIDPKAFQAEAEKPLTEELLQVIGNEINDDVAGTFGYEGWKAEFKEIEVENK